MATTANEWINVAWENEYRKEQTSSKREAEEAMRRVNVQVINDGDIMIATENYTDRKVAWRKLGW